MNEKVKAFGKAIKDNAESIVAVTIGVAVGVGFIALLAVSIKADNDEYNREIAEAAENKKMLRDAVARGASVLPAPDGGYWIINNTPE